jgi:hypothetical protein
LIRIQISCFKATKNSGIVIAVSAGDKKLKLFFALQTLNENSVEVENQPGCPAWNQRAFVSSIGGDSGLGQCFQWFGRQIRSPAKVRLIK